MGKDLNGKELGEGISQRKDGRYVARFTNRFGKRENIYGHTVKDVRELLRKARALDDEQGTSIDKNITLDQWYEKCKSTFKQHCRNTTLRTYDIIYQKIKPHLGNMKVCQITTFQIQEMINSLKSDKSRKDCRALLSDIFKCAINNNIISRNPVIKINVRKNNDQTPERVTLNDNQINALLNRISSQSRNIKPIIILALNTGMREGEILGLCWDCVDFEKKIIHVKRTLIYLPNDKVNATYELHEPKTITSRRDIPMLPIVENVLIECKKRYELIKQQHPDSNKFDLVFTSNMGNPINEANLRSSLIYWTDIVNKEHGSTFIPHFTMHNLRHTFATNCVLKGMPPKVLQKILGHKNITTTLNLYCHTSYEYMAKELFKVMGENDTDCTDE